MTLIVVIIRWFVVMNYFVHSLMYSYYTLRALRLGKQGIKQSI